MQLFYAPQISNNFYCFDEIESKHITRVLRMKEGDTLYLTDGKGRLYEGEIVQSDWKQCCVSYELKNEEYGRRNYRIHIAVAPTKSMDRFEWFVEKATEIGIDEITPLICDNSERKTIKPERIERIIIAAMKQSLKTYKPLLNDMTEFNTFIGRSFPSDEVKMIAHCAEGERGAISSIYKQGQNATILIGPEGDFSLDEIETAIRYGLSPITLGECRLRTETAAVVACNTIQILNL